MGDMFVEHGRKKKYGVAGLYSNTRKERRCEVCVNCIVRAHFMDLVCGQLVRYFDVLTDLYFFMSE
jgi:hypothetical protein